MNKFLTALTIATTLGSIVSPAQAHTDNPPVVNGMPCIAEVCIGDDIKSLKHIQWKSIDLTDIAPQYLRKIDNLAIGTPADIKAFTPYWNARVVDKKAILILSRLKAVCKTSSYNRPLRGQYIAKNGKPVSVTFSIIPSPDRKSQRIVVTRIFKLLHEGQMTTQQSNDLIQAIKKQYAEIPSNDSLLISAYPTAEFGIAEVFQQGLQLDAVGNSYNRIKDEDIQTFPGCAGERIPLD
jgi:hypothetical protein